MSTDTMPYDPSVSDPHPLDELVPAPSQTAERERIRYKEAYEQSCARYQQACAERDAYAQEKRQAVLRNYEQELALRQLQKVIGYLEELCAVYKHLSGFVYAPRPAEGDDNPF